GARRDRRPGRPDRGGDVDGPGGRAPSGGGPPGAQRLRGAERARGSALEGGRGRARGGGRPGERRAPAGRGRRRGPRASPEPARHPHRAGAARRGDAPAGQSPCRRRGRSGCSPSTAWTSSPKAAPAEVWLNEVLGRRFGARAVYAGSSYTFGHRREGTAARVAEWGRARGVEVHLVPAVLVRGEPVSSSRIRSALREGLVDEAAQLLGRYHSVSGQVVPGQGRGRTLGYPTANLQPASPRKLLPARGVYATIAAVRGRRYGGATNIGVRPTFGGTHLAVETFLLEFDGDL